MMQKSIGIFLTLCLLLSLLTGCSTAEGGGTSIFPETRPTATAAAAPDTTPSTTPSQPDVTFPDPQQTPQETNTSAGASGAFQLASIPGYSGAPYVAVNGNTPFFTEGEITPSSFEQYAPLDSAGRCGTAVASIGKDLMPTEDRGNIGMVKPSGWHTVKYDCVDGKYLYNRCHLIGFQLTGENANSENLITGTRYLNIEGMLPFENMTADYVKETGNHVMYRVTPIFEGDNLVASGVLMEGWSVEDRGEGICFCVFAYNVQPGITIDYATGASSLAETPSKPQPTEPTEPPAAPACQYVLNVSTKIFHRPSCQSVERMKESNRQDFSGSRDTLLTQGYKPCKNCNP